MQRQQRIEKAREDESRVEEIKQDEERLREENEANLQRNRDMREKIKKQAEDDQARNKAQFEGLLSGAAADVERERTVVWTNQLEAVLMDVTRAASFDFGKVAALMSERLGGVTIDAEACRLRFAEVAKRKKSKKAGLKWTDELDQELKTSVRSCVFDFDAVAKNMQKHAVLQSVTPEACRLRFAELSKKKPSKAKVQVPWTPALEVLLAESVRASKFDFDAVAVSFTAHLKEQFPSTEFMVSAEICRVQFSAVHKRKKAAQTVEWTAALDSQLQGNVRSKAFDFDAVSKAMQAVLKAQDPDTVFDISGDVCRFRFSELAKMSKKQKSQSPASSSEQPEAVEAEEEINPLAQVVAGLPPRPAPEYVPPAILDDQHLMDEDPTRLHMKLRYLQFRRINNAADDDDDSESGARSKLSPKKSDRKFLTYDEMYAQAASQYVEPRFAPQDLPSIGVIGSDDDDEEEDEESSQTEPLSRADILAQLGLKPKVDAGTLPQLN
jgi:hypothetical protein